MHLLHFYSQQCLSVWASFGHPNHQIHTSRHPVLKRGILSNINYKLIVLSFCLFVNAMAILHFLLGTIIVSMSNSSLLFSICQSLVIMMGILTFRIFSLNPNEIVKFRKQKIVKFRTQKLNQIYSIANSSLIMLSAGYHEG